MMEQAKARPLAREWAQQIRSTRRKSGTDWTGRAEDAETYAVAIQLRDFVPDDAVAAVLTSDRHSVVVGAVVVGAIFLVSATSEEDQGLMANGRGECVRLPLDPREARLTAATEAKNGFSGLYHETSWKLEVAGDTFGLVSRNPESDQSATFARALATALEWKLPEASTP